MPGGWKESKGSWRDGTKRTIRLDAGVEDGRVELDGDIIRGGELSGLQEVVHATHGLRDREWG